MNTVQIVRFDGGEAEALYVNGRFESQNEAITVEEIVDALPGCMVFFDVNVKDVDDDWLDSQNWILPELYSDLVFRKA